jgi:hypothetical protein
MADIPDELVVPDHILQNIYDGMGVTGAKLIKGTIPEGPGLLPSTSRDLPEFYSEVAVILDDYQNRLNINPADRITLCEDSPPVSLTTQVISYKVKKRVPGAVSPARPGVSSSSRTRHEWVPRCRYIIEDEKKPNTKTFVMGQFFDNMIEFTCWARSNKAANSTALLFQDLMNNYRFYFKLKGFSEVIFQERLEDMQLDTETQGNTLKGRPLTFYVRTDRTFSITEAVLRDIVLNLGISNS